MNSTATRSVSRQVSAIMTSMAMALGAASSVTPAVAAQEFSELRLTPAVVGMARQRAVSSKKPAGKARADRLIQWQEARVMTPMLDFRDREAFETVQQKLLEVLDGVIAVLEEGQQPGDFNHGMFQAHLDAVREMERSMDARIATANLSGQVVSDNYRKVRRGLAKVRLKTVHITSQLRYISGDIERFDGQADVHGLQHVAQLGTDRAVERLH
ncbi:hypothetical protein [Salinicola halophyticus]|uniref:hypothetical protein n=1 Tax=Salinicola halophyticus TaxID=1808881 RepID=UPI003F4774F2